MQSCGARCRVGLLVVFFLWIGLSALYGLLKPVPGGCVMTYMYPTYIPIETDANVASGKYGLYLYHEGWKTINFKEYLGSLDGVPVLFIPGNGGSYKQVRSLAAESSRAFQGGPLEPSYYQEASFAIPGDKRDGLDGQDELSFSSSKQYTRKLDWFAVDLEEEHSALDGQIIEEHTEYVVYAIHKILDQYKESKHASSRDLPTSVILVGHSMGGFVARAAVIHPHLRKSSVETILTLSSPHQSPPVALQPSLGHLFSDVNSEWREGYDIHTANTGRFFSGPKLSNVVVISISGGVNDHQIRTKSASLEGIVPPTHGFTISSSSVKNVWLSVDHQSILWCNQLVIQISHTLLSLINPDTGKLFPGTQKRLSIFNKMIQSGVSHSFHRIGGMQQPSLTENNARHHAGSEAIVHTHCPPSIHWPGDGLEKDLYVQSRTVTVLAMDGRRRWLDIHSLGSEGKDHFILVTNLAPCYGIRLHLWPEKNRTSETAVPANKGILEVSSRMVHIPAGPAPRQIEPGSQTEQAPPSAVLHLDPNDLRGYRYLTISVAPRPTVSGRPPPAASMAVGQFFNPKEGQVELSHLSVLRTLYHQQEMFLSEDHPLPINLDFSLSLGLLPVTLSVETVDCGIKGSGTHIEKQAGDVEHSSLCKLRCFPPVALAWDAMAGVHIVPNLFSETIQVDSSPAMWGSDSKSDKTLLLLLVDPHCSYKVSVSASLISASSRFILIYSSQIIGLMTAVVFFALMRQAHAWDIELPIPSIITAMEMNLRMPYPFLIFALLPIFIVLFLSLVTAQPCPSVATFIVVSSICFVIANGCLSLLVLSSQSVLYLAASLHIFVRKRWLGWEESYHFIFFHQILNFLSNLFSFKFLRVLKDNPDLILALVAMVLVILVHPSVGLILLLLVHAYNCHIALCSEGKEASRTQYGGMLNQILPYDENHSNAGPASGKSFTETQLELFNYRHSLLILHLLAAVMFGPSLVARLQRTTMNHSFIGLLDSVLSIGIIIHGIYSWKPGINSIKFTLPGIPCRNMGLSFIYLLCGYYCSIYALASAPFRAIHAMAAIGAISLLSRILDRSRERGDIRFGKTRKHSHKHK